MATNRDENGTGGEHPPPSYKKPPASPDSPMSATNSPTASSAKREIACGVAVAAAKKASLRTGSPGDTQDDDTDASSGFVEFVVPGGTYRDYSLCFLDLAKTGDLNESVEDTFHIKHFPTKLHRILSDADVCGFDDCISWLPHGRSFRIHSERGLEDRVLPKYCMSNKAGSFMRLVSCWGFRRVPSDGSYFHEFMLKGLPHLAMKVSRTQRKRVEQNVGVIDPDFCAISNKRPLPALSEHVIGQRMQGSAIVDGPSPNHSHKHSSIAVRMTVAGQSETHIDRTVEGRYQPEQSHAATAVGNVLSAQRAGMVLPTTNAKISHIQERLSQNAAATSAVLSAMRKSSEGSRDSTSIQSFPQGHMNQVVGGVASEMQALRTSPSGGQQQQSHFPEIVAAKILANSRTGNVHRGRDADILRVSSGDVGEANLVASVEQLLHDRKQEKEQELLLEAATSILRIARNKSSSGQGQKALVLTPRQQAQRKLEEAAANFILCSDGASTEALSDMQPSQLSESEIRLMVRAEVQEEVRRVFLSRIQR